MNQEDKTKSYQAILNNLFSFRYFDSCIFTNLNKNNLNLNLFLSQEKIENILKKNSFTLEMKYFSNTNKEKNFLDDLKRIGNLGDEAQIKSLISKYNIVIPKNKQKNAYTMIDYFLLKQKTKNEKFLKKYCQRIIDWYESNNIWPLYIATGFIKCKIKSNFFYAPLILKEVQIEKITKNDKNIFKLKSLYNNWQINSKLFFLFNNLNICNQDIDIVNLKNNNAFESIDKISKFILYQKNDFDPNILSKNFVKISRREIQNNIIEFCPGTVLGFFKVEGNLLRSKVQEIIKNDELELILDSSLNKIKFYDNINQEIFNNERPIFKIQPLNYSQSKAVISSVKQNTVVWGPPGTGKSQTIANIIANIIANKKTAIIMSQKRAALSILKKRLNNLDKFILFLIDENISKKIFYQKLNIFLYSIRIEALKLFQNFPDFNSHIRRKDIPEQTSNSILSNELKQYLNTLIFLNKKQETKIDLNYIFLWKQLNLYPNLSNVKKQEIISWIFLLEKNFIFPNTFNWEEKFSSFLKKMIKLNKIQKIQGFFHKKYDHKIIKKIRRIYKCFKEIYNYVNLNLNNYQPIINSEFYGNETNFKNLDIIIHFDFNNLITKHDFHDDTEKLDHYFSQWIATKIYNMKVDQHLKKSNLYYRFTLFSKAIESSWQKPKTFLNRYQNVITNLFPIIVSTPENFIYPKLLRKENFDYAVFDESSQIFPELAIPFLYSSKIKIIVGDLNQMRPTKWFRIRQELNKNKLIDQRDIITESESLLDYGLNKGLFKILLEKNYRFENKKIINFSNKNFYKNKLDIINQQDKRNTNNIEVIDIEGSITYKYNKLVILKTIEVIKKNIPKYKKIIVLAFNSKHKDNIEDYIFEFEERLIYYIDEKKLIIRNLENIQGDETDLIIISLDYDKYTRFKSTYICSYNGSYALNVAITRATQKMIVIKSFNYENLQKITNVTNDFLIFKKWIKYLDSINKPKTKNFEEEKQEKILIQRNLFATNIFNELKKIIEEKKFNNLNIKQNLNIGFKNIPIYFQKNNKFILGIIFLKIEEIINVQNKNIKNIYNQFLKRIDYFNYLKNKKYEIIIINKIEWKFKKEILLRKIINFLTKSIQSVEPIS